MKSSLISLIIASIIGLVLAFYIGGMQLLAEALYSAWATTLSALPFLLIAFVVVGQLKYVLSVDLVNNWLKGISGIKGVLACSICGGFISGPYYATYTLVAGYFQKGVPLYMLLSLIIGKRIYNFNRIPVEVGLISPELVLFRYLITLPIPILMGYLAYKLFPDELVSSKLEAGCLSDG